MGDVVATKTSLQYALNEIVNTAVQQYIEFRNIVFFTYGGKQAEIILKQIDIKCRDLFAGYQRTFVIYFEGRFTVSDQYPTYYSAHWHRPFALSYPHGCRTYRITI